MVFMVIKKNNQMIDCLLASLDMIHLSFGHSPCFTPLVHSTSGDPERGIKQRAPDAGCTPLTRGSPPKASGGSNPGSERYFFSPSSPSAFFTSATVPATVSSSTSGAHPHGEAYWMRMTCDW